MVRPDPASTSSSDREQRAELERLQAQLRRARAALCGGPANPLAALQQQLDEAKAASAAGRARVAELEAEHYALLEAVAPPGDRRPLGPVAMILVAGAVLAAGAWLVSGW